MRRIHPVGGQEPGCVDWPHFRSAEATVRGGHKQIGVQPASPIVSDPREVRPPVDRPTAARRTPSPRARLHPFLPFLVTASAPLLTAQATPAPMVLTAGRVVDALGDPIPAAEVLATAGGRPLARATADGEGMYRIRLPATGGELTVRAPGKAAARLPWRGLATPRVRNVVLEDAADLSGRVLDAAGQAVAHATVLVVAKGHTSLTTTTDARGAYTFPGVPLRPLLLYAAREDARVEAHVRLVDKATHDLTLPTTTGGGCLVQVHGVPATAEPDAFVRIYGADFLAVQNGGRVPLRRDGTATVVLQRDCLLEVPLPGLELTPRVHLAGPTATRAEFTVKGPLDANAGTLLQGRVRTLTGNAVGGVLLVVRDRSHRELGSTLADRDGGFRLRVAMPADGFCRVALAVTEWQVVADDLTVVDGCSWAPVNAPQDRVDLLAERTGIVQGAVRGPDGSLFALADLVVADVQRVHRELVHTHTDQAGQFTVGLPAGDHELLAVAHDGRVCRASLRVTSGGHHEPQWQSIAVGSIAGMLRDGAGKAVPGVELFVASRVLQDSHAANASERQHCTVVTDRAGRFRCRGLPVGDWTIVSTTDGDVVCTQVAVQAGRTTDVDLGYAH